MSLKIKLFLLPVLAIFLLGISPVLATGNVNLGVDVFTCKVDGVCAVGETNISCPLDCYCGNGTIEAGEACDAGGSNGTCPSTCNSSCQTQCCTNCGGSVHTLTIDNINVSDITNGGAKINWTTSYDAICKVSWGLTNQYGAATSLEIEAIKNHSSSLTGLLPATTYHFQISCTDSFPSSATSNDGNFITATTLVDLTAPHNVTALTADPGNGHIFLSWINPTDVDFAGVSIRRSTSSIPSLTEGSEVFNGPGTAVNNSDKVSYDDLGLVNGVLYYYTVFAYDTSTPSNVASGVGVQATPYLTTTTPVNVKDLRLMAGDQQLTLFWTEPDDVDYAGVYIRRSLVSTPSFTSGELVFSGRGYASGSEFNFTDTGLVNNQLYFYTVFAYRNSGFHASGVSLSGRPFVEEAATSTPTSTPPYGTTTPPFVTSTPPYGTTTPPLGFDLLFRDFDFLQNDQALTVSAADSVNISTNLETLIRLPATQAPPGTKKLVLNLSVDGTVVSYPFQYGQASGYYLVSLPGLNQEAKYWATILVYNQNDQVIKTVYGWLEATKPQEETPLVISVITEDVIKPIQAALKPVQEIAKTPAAQAGAVVTVAASVANIVVAVPWWNWWYLLQFLFTQPFQLFFRRKGWGVVYNSITKKPVDLALVRLYDTKTNRLVASRVTDHNGRYIFLVDVGEYYLRVEKPNFEFPDQLLKNTRDDGNYLDLYYGDTIKVAPGQKVAIIANIPLDPSDRQISDAEIIKHFSKERQARYLSWLGPIFSLVYLALFPSWVALGVVILHLVFLIYFRRLAQRKSGKKWGVVYDADSKQPLKKSITRIFSSEYGRMLEYYVTDSQGRYGFLVGGNKYYVMADKDGYGTTKTPIIDLTQGATKDDIIARDLALIKLPTTTTPEIVAPELPTPTPAVMPETTTAEPTTPPIDTDTKTPLT